MIDIINFFKNNNFTDQGYNNLVASISKLFSMNNLSLYF